MEKLHPTAESNQMPPQRGTEMLQEVLSILQSLQGSHDRLVASVKIIDDRVNVFVNQNKEEERVSHLSRNIDREHGPPLSPGMEPLPRPVQVLSSPQTFSTDNIVDGAPKERETQEKFSKGATNSKIILTTYPHQSGIDPIKMNWGDTDPLRRGPVVVSRAPSTMRRRNGKL